MSLAMPARKCANALCALAFASLAGCALGRAPQPLVLTPQTVLLEVPEVPQEEAKECGLASLATLAGYHGVAIPPDARARLATIARERDGLSGGELREVLREIGLETFLFQGTLDWQATGLYHQIDRGRPPLVMISPDGDTAHACLFTGYDPSTRQVFLYDPLRGHVGLAEADFADLWERALRFTLLAVPLAAQQPPPSPRPRERIARRERDPRSTESLVSTIRTQPEE
jgi:ABC-type bacteriocin/lantibiotic exporter with double-glycine peptidase domain